MYNYGDVEMIDDNFYTGAFSFLMGIIFYWFEITKPISLIFLIAGFLLMIIGFFQKEDSLLHKKKKND